MSEPEGAGTGALIAGRYRLGDAIGHGGMATVFRAWDEKLERTVAVKVFVTGEPNPDDTARRLREVHLLASANHPHLVTLFDAEWPTTQAGRPGFLVMELVEGESLRRRIDRVGRDPQLAQRVAIELSEALAYLHEQGIVHRDLKPENILIDSSTGATKLVDFGIAQFAGAERITTDGTVLGTAAYLSPEQVRGLPVTPATDVYALGLVVLECVTGQRTFPGPAVEAAIARVATDAPIPAGLPTEWRDLLAGMTSREPQGRPSAASVAPVARALDAPALAEEDVDADADTVAMAPPDVIVSAEPTTRYPAMADDAAALGAEPTAVGSVSGAAAADPPSVDSAETGAEADAATDAARSRRRSGILVGAVATLCVGGAALAFALDSGHRDANAGPTPAATPAPTVTVTALTPQPVTTPAVQHSRIAATPLPPAAPSVSGTSGRGAGTGTGATPAAGPGAGAAAPAGPAGAGGAGAPVSGHGAAHGTGKQNGGAKGKGGG